jgi:nucleoid-associated protein YgaU
VQPGDTLWGIVSEHCSGDVRAAVSNVAADPAALQPGQVITLP